MHCLAQLGTSITRSVPNIMFCFPMLLYSCPSYPSHLINHDTPLTVLLAHAAARKDPSGEAAKQVIRPAGLAANMPHSAYRGGSSVTCQKVTFDPEEAATRSLSSHITCSSATESASTPNVSKCSPPDPNMHSDLWKQQGHQASQLILLGCSTCCTLAAPYSRVVCRHTAKSCICSLRLGSILLSLGLVQAQYMQWSVLLCCASSQYSVPLVVSRAC